MTYTMIAYKSSHFDERRDGYYGSDLDFVRSLTRGEIVEAAAKLIASEEGWEIRIISDGPCDPDDFTTHGEADVWPDDMDPDIRARSAEIRMEHVRKEAEAQRERNEKQARAQRQRDLEDFQRLGTKLGVPPSKLEGLT